MAGHQDGEIIKTGGVAIERITQSADSILHQGSTDIDTIEPVGNDTDLNAFDRMVQINGCLACAERVICKGQIRPTPSIPP